MTRLDLRDNPLITDLHALLSAVREVRGLDRSADLPLDELICLGRHTTNRTGLRGLEYWSGLTGRSLGPLTTELTARDRQAVADRPR
ncbi:hypothetical protein [Streptomyces sp. NPDC005374]|uniref:hypothetical protein n=1 Tax=Streptomyces sp. NPDC005374 TaxID=3364713 RepID=UPI0036AA5E4B